MSSERHFSFISSDFTSCSPSPAFTGKALSLPCLGHRLHIGHRPDIGNRFDIGLGLYIRHRLYIGHRLHIGYRGRGQIHLFLR